jgi:hypothetical protein
VEKGESRREVSVGKKMSVRSHRGMEVISMIKWEESLDVSIKRARDENKLILMDFFNPH